jgi:tetratricopeptide (TPR) repeat protein
MRYVPHLIPEQSKVLRDYFTGKEYGNKISGLKKVLCITGTVIFFLYAIAFYSHPVVLLTFAVLGAGLLLPVHQWLESTFRFRFTTLIKTCLYLLLIIPSLIIIGNSKEIKEAAVVQQENVKEEKVQKEEVKETKKVNQEQLLLAVKDSIRRDSLQQDLHILNDRSALSKMGKPQIDARYAHAFALAVTPDEKSALENVKAEMVAVDLQRLLTAKKYKDALPILDELIAQTPSNSDLLYKRAICYDKTGNPQASVNDLKVAMEMGSTDAEAYHEKINPERKKVTGYHTLCCDGSTSNSTGRGTCSHHGGVCGREAEYETYRKY